uniref:Uncharacterized protein n=1 Tax=Graphocephala atropunctata TaxID=36148 RepID=A0A1B6LJV6_9HEMI
MELDTEVQVTLGLDTPELDMEVRDTPVTVVQDTVPGLPTMALPPSPWFSPRATWPTPMRSPLSREHTSVPWLRPLTVTMAGRLAAMATTNTNRLTDCCDTRIL